MHFHTRAPHAAAVLEPEANSTAAIECALAAEAVVVRHLVKAYKSVRAVNDISFTVAPGEMLGLLGPNGAGKTTTLSMILGLRRPDSGEVSIFGERVDPKNRRYKAMLGAQLQRTEFPENWTPFEVLRLFATFHPDPFSPADLLARFGLEGKRSALVKTLSGGQLRRLGLAVAIVGRPQVLCLDEPTSGLDAHARRTLWEIIRELRESGLTILLTTHSMEEAESLCDRVAIIDDGRILAIDPPRRLIQRHFPERAIEFEASGPLDTETLEALPSVSRAQVGEPGCYTLFTEDPLSALAALLRWAESRRLPLADVRIRTATLEDVFIQMTGRRIHA
jgi:ABC-2 type transport system ATP-binding protein